MDKFKEKFIRFMYGRYGVYGQDALYKFLFYASMVLIIVNLILTVAITSGLVKSILSGCISVAIILMLGYSVFRFLSKNIPARRKENEIYVKITKALKRFFTFNTALKTRSHNRDTETLIFRDCTYCGSVLRLPRRVGRNKVKCPRCSKSFYVKAGKYKQPKKK